MTQTKSHRMMLNLSKSNLSDSSTFELHEAMIFRGDDQSWSSTSHADKINALKFLVQNFLMWTQTLLTVLQVKLSFFNIGILTVVLVALMPKVITYMIIYPTFRLLFGTLYPAYSSYKAVRTKNVKEYVKWMMYWIVFALFTAVETFTDVFFSFWFPFYYEIKIILVVWMLSPATKGSSILYRRFVHPALVRRENEIDEAIAKATEQGYTAVLHFGTKGVNYATTVLMQTAIKGGGGLVQQLKKSYSLSDLSGDTEDENRNMTKSTLDETDMQIEPRRREHIGRRGYSPRRTQSSNNNRVEMYFSEVDLEVRQSKSRESINSLNNIKSSEDISSGYSSGEALHSQRGLAQTESSLVRTASVGARIRTKQPRTITKKTTEGEDYFVTLPVADISVANPLTIISAEQALNMLMLLSEHEACADLIRMGQNVVPDTIRNLSRIPSVESLYSSSSETLKEEIDIPETANKTVKEEQEIENKETEENEIKVEKETEQTSKEIKEQEMKEGEQEKREERKEMIERLKEYKGLLEVNKDNNKPDDKYMELKVLIDDAKRVVSNVVHCQEKRNLDLILKPEENLRAGRYHKKAAPKAPIMEPQKEDIEKAVKATLVIKSGALTTITKVSDEKYEPKKKSGLSKLLNVPRNIFHHTFHKEEEGNREDQRSRSSSFGEKKNEESVDLITGDDEGATRMGSKKTSAEKLSVEEDNDSERQGRPMLITRLSESPGRSTKRHFSITD